MPKRSSSAELGQLDRQTITGARAGPEESLWQSVNLAAAGARHAEIVVQARLSNFLFADSILFLSWATVFATKEAGAREAVLVVFAGLSAGLSLVWMVLGWRQQKFLDLNFDLMAAHEQKLREDQRVNWWIWKLQHGQSVSTDRVKSTRLRRPDTWVNSRSILVVAPAAFMAASLLLLWASVA